MISTVNADGWTVKFYRGDDLASEFQSTFSTIVWATGVGQDGCEVRPDPQQPPTFCGFPFWSSDFYRQHDYGLKKEESPARIIISGAGDGGLQDFLRIVTKYDSPSDLLQVLDLPARVTSEL